MTATPAASPAVPPDGGPFRFPAANALRLDPAPTLEPLEIGYKTYGTLNAVKTNAILVCHALTGDQHAASVNPLTNRPGWWDTVIGAGLPLDPARYFIIATNVVGGCMGSTGPASI